MGLISNSVLDDAPEHGEEDLVYVMEGGGDTNSSGNDGSVGASPSSRKLVAMQFNAFQNSPMDSSKKLKVLMSPRGSPREVGEAATVSVRSVGPKGQKGEISPSDAGYSGASTIGMAGGAYAASSTAGGATQSAVSGRSRSRSPLSPSQRNARLL